MPAGLKREFTGGLFLGRCIVVEYYLCCIRSVQQEEKTMSELNF